MRGSKGDAMSKRKTFETIEDVVTNGVAETIEETQATLEDAQTAASEGDEDAFDAAIADANKRIASIEGDLKWLKAEAKKAGPANQSMNLMLENLSSQMAEMKTQVLEMTEKFQNLSLPPSSPEPEPAETIPTETPAVQAARPPAPNQSEGDAGDHAGHETRVVRKLRPI